MCGIIGYVGSREAWPLIQAGLQRLEYRGYDSAGVVTLGSDKKPEFHQAVGRVKDLVSSLNGRSPRGTLGLGHTRWATHGRTILANTHPHTGCDGQVAIVHNGIVENFLELKDGLISRGHKFSSETDTEVLAHMIEEDLNAGRDFDVAFSRMAARIRGANVVAAIWQEEPHRILGMRSGNAGGIAVARREGETILASDLGALAPFANEVKFLEDGEIVSATPDGARYFDFHGKALTKIPFPMPENWFSVSKDGYRHFMLKEIMEQPVSLGSALQGRVDMQCGKVVLEDFPLSDGEIADLRKVVILGSGTSHYASMVGRHLVERLAGLSAEAESSSEFRYREPVLDEHTLVVSVGQSGETADTLSAMEEARERGARVLTICNVEGSQASRTAEGTLAMRAGPEIGVASTKTFVASMGLLALLSLYISQANGFITERARRDLLHSLNRLPNLIGATVSDHAPYKRLARWLSRYNHVLYLGRGINHPIALEGALKLKEVSYIHAEGYAAGELKHGPIALIDQRMPTVAIAPPSGLYDKMLNSIKEVKARDGLVIAVGDREDVRLTSQVDHVLHVPSVHELLTPFVTVAPLQLLAYYVAVERGCDVDQPRNLAKSVTVE